MQKKHHRNFILGCCITGVMLLLIVVGAFWTPYDPELMDTAAKLPDTFAPVSLYTLSSSSRGSTKYSSSGCVLMRTEAEAAS